MLGRFCVVLAVLVTVSSMLVASPCGAGDLGCTITGTEVDDVLAGTAGDDVIRGGDGNDDLHGNEDADEIHGEAGVYASTNDIDRVSITTGIADLEGYIPKMILWQPTP